MLDKLLTTGVLVMLRFSSALITMPVFSSPGIPARMKALVVLMLVVVLTPFAACVPGAEPQLTMVGLLGEVVVGVAFGLTLSLLMEAVLFSASLMSGAFSFSLVNLIDPNSHTETEVLGTILNWVAILVLLAAGLHRTMLGALMHTLTTVPVGHAFVGGRIGVGISTLASGVFFSGLQIAVPVVAAALLVEVAVGLISRMTPAMPAQIASVPLKTIVSHVVLTGGLALWPGWIERHFTILLDSAQRQAHV